MLVVSTILSAGLLGLIIYFLVSPKSSRLLRLAALGALVLIALAIGVCGVLLILGPSQKQGDDIVLPVFQDAAPPVKSSSNFPAIFISLVLFVVVVGLIIYFYTKGKGKKNDTTKNGKDSAVFPNDDGLDIGKPGSEEIDEMEDTFDI